MTPEAQKIADIADRDLESNRNPNGTVGGLVALAHNVIKGAEMVCHELTAIRIEIASLPRTQR